MLGSSGECSHTRHACLALGLCLLAFLFAVEAKTAWFGPVVGPGSCIRASKALPANLPKVVEHGVPVPDPVHPQLPFVALAFVTIACIVGKNRGAVDTISLARRPIFTFVPICPPSFFRPPPVR